MRRNRIAPPNGAFPPPENSRHANPPKDLPSPTERQEGVSGWKNRPAFLQASGPRRQTLQFLLSVARRFAHPNRLQRRRSNAPVSRSPASKENRLDQQNVRENNEKYGDRDCPNRARVGPAGISGPAPPGSGWPNTHARPQRRIGNLSPALPGQASEPGFAWPSRTPGGHR